jgi:hypothetical protein
MRRQTFAGRSPTASMTRTCASRPKSFCTVVVPTRVKVTPGMFSLHARRRLLGTQRLQQSRHYRAQIETHRTRQRDRSSGAQPRLQKQLHPAPRVRGLTTDRTRCPVRPSTAPGPGPVLGRPRRHRRWGASARGSAGAAGHAAGRRRLAFGIRQAKSRGLHCLAVLTGAHGQHPKVARHQFHARPAQC